MTAGDLLELLEGMDVRLGADVAVVTRAGWMAVVEARVVGGIVVLDLLPETPWPTSADSEEESE